MLRRTLPQHFRRTAPLLGGGLSQYHEWSYHEPLLINYEGWRILDNPTMTLKDCWVTDIGGFGRHLDPIIDDPRLTHQQRVCRLYRWALKEMRCWITKLHSGKFNLGYKVVRNRFEKYRYVTDPAMCDMMVRQTQKYLRETCCLAFLRYDPRSPYNCNWQTHPMFHPDNCLVYDHWTGQEVALYDDAKLHRYFSHHPMTSSYYEVSDRFGEMGELKMIFRRPMLIFQWMTLMYIWLYATAFFHTKGMDDPYFEIYNKYHSVNMRQAIEATERRERSKYAKSTLRREWDVAMGKIYFKLGYHAYMGKHLKGQPDERNRVELKYHD